MNPFSTFFWYCAGANAEILKQCPTDQKRFANIGVIIFLVACFASIAMYFAIQTIISNQLAAIGVAVLWGIMIFYLDRLIVNTIEKSDSFRRQFWSASPRILLAAIIALVISRPIEIKLFEELIEKQIMVDILTEQESYKSRKEALADVGDLRQRREENLGFIAAIDSVSSLPEPNTPEYQRAKSAFLTAKQRSDGIKAQYQPRITELNRLIQAMKDTSNDEYYELNEVPPTGGLGTWTTERVEKPGVQNRRTAYRKEFREKIKVRNDANKKTSGLKSTKDSLETAFYGALSEQKQQYTQNTLHIENTQNEIAENINQELADQNVISEKYGNTFFKQLRALNNLGYDVDQDGNLEKNVLWYAKWMVFLLFFVIEVSPVLAKLLSPNSAYDLAYHAKSSADFHIFRENQEARKFIAEVLREEWKKDQLSQNKNNNPFST